MMPKKIDETVLDPKKLTGPQKAAVFLITMGEEYSSKAFSTMDPEEIREVALAMSTIEQIPTEVLEAVCEDYIERFEGGTKLVIRGNSFLQGVMSGALGDEQAAAVFRDLEDRKRDVPFVWSKNVDVSVLANYVEGEHPQTIAMILAHLPPDVAAEVMMNIPDERKGDIALRVALLNQIPDEVVRDVDAALKAELSERGGGTGGKVGGVQVLVDILNGVDKSTEDTIMEAIEEERSEMAGDIRDMMFVFEDLMGVDDKAMREILKTVEGQDLTYALKTASEEMRNKIFSNLSMRAAEMLTEDLEVMGPVRLAEVEDAQQAIVRSAKDLEASGTIVLGGKGKEDVLV